MTAELPKKGGIRMKKIINNVVILCIVFVLCINTAYASNVLSTDTIKSNGVALVILPDKVFGKVTLAGETDRALIKILVIKDEKQTWYDVNLVNGKFNEEIWLIDGKGNYEISVLVHKIDRKYNFGPTVRVENVSDVNRFLVPTKHVESNNEELINAAQEITRNAGSDREKAKLIYDWITKNIVYDYKKYLRQLNKNYDNVYGAYSTYKTRTGVCYDYSTLFAALGRAVGLQVKVIKGNFVTSTSEELHAWNEIYISEEDRWINVDSTFGYSLGKNYFDNADFNVDHVKIEEY